ncbi:MAG: hypothetical protein EOM72_01690 [Opitutae bacterium]|nr:hypothetical protein [Opitutae bacterium]
MNRKCWVLGMAMLVGAGGAEASMSLYPPQHLLAGSALVAAPDPVSADAGSFYFALPLLRLGGPMNLGFTLHYNSNGARSNFNLLDLPENGPWWWDPMATLQPHLISGTNYWQFQVEGGQAVAFTEQPDGSWRLTDETDFGLANSPVAFQAQRTNGWAYLLDPRTGRIKMFANFTNNDWRIVAQADRNGNALVYTYRPPTNVMEFFQPIRIEDNFGRWYGIGYAAQGYNWEYYIDTLTDHAGRQVRFEYENGGDVSGNMQALRHVVDVGGGTNRFTYAPFTNDFTIYRAVIGGYRLPAGNTPWTQAYDALRLYSGDGGNRPVVTNQADAYGNAISFAYDTNAHTVAAAWPDGGSNVFRHAGRNLPPVQVDAPGGAQTTFAVDGRSRIAGMTDATGAGIGFGFDPTNALISSVTNAAGEVLRFEYAAAEQVITNPAAPGEMVAFTFHDLAAIRHPDGTAEEFSYDGRGNVTGAVDRAGQATAFAYDAHGNLTERTAPGGGTATFEYDAAARLVAAVDADGVTNRFEYDALDRVTNAVDGAGNATAYETDAAGRLLKMVHPDGLETLFAYDANGNRLGTTARDGAVTAAGYDLMDRVAVATNALGGATAYAYDAMGRVAEAAGPDGVTNRYQYDPAGRVTNETRAGVSVAATYDGEGRVASRTTPRGNLETFGYDADGRLVAATNALGHAARFERDAAGRVTNAVDALGGRTSAAYADGRLVARTDAEGRAVQLAYDAAGRLAVATAPDGAQTTCAYTSAGRLAGVTNPLGAAAAYEYDAAGRLKTATDPLGRNTAYEYDEMGRVSLVTDAASNEWGFATMDAVGMSLAANPLGGQQTTFSLPGGYPAMRFDSETDPWTYQWDAAGRLVETADPLGNATTVAYDDFGRVAAVTNPLGHAVGFEYDADGNRVRTVDPLGAESRAHYDVLGQVTSVVDRAGGAATFAYDELGRLVRAADGDGVAVETDYDATGRPLVRRAGAEAWTNAYDAAGRLATVASPLGHVQTLRRDALGRVTNAVDAAGGVAAYDYDAAGRRVAQTDAEGRATAYEYDLLDGLARVTLNGGASAAYERDALGNVVRIVDLGSNEWTRAWTPMGRWLEDVDPLGRTNACERDELGRVARLLRADGSTVDVRHDAAGQVTGRVWSAGLELAYAYDAAGRLAAADGVALARDAAGRVTNALVNGQAYAAAWTPGGRLASVAYADGAFAVAYAYDPVSGRLATVSDALTGTQVAFAYDADGRLVRQTDSHGGTNDFTYDAAGRVTRIQATPGIDLQYVYDAAGRLLSETREVPKPAGALLAAGADVNQFDAAAQLANPSAAYDGLARRTADDRYQYQWSPNGLLTNVAPSAFPLQPSAFSYDAFGSITARDGQPLACHPALGGAPLVDDGTNWYVWTPGGALLYVVAQAEGHAVHHYRFDYSGNAVALVDAVGAVAEAYAYEPGGLELEPAPSALGNPFRFLGRHGIRAEGTGDLYHVRARWYDARTRAFLSPEPLWPQTANPHALNPYIYANADPVNFADVSGRDLIPRKTLWIMLVTQDFSFGELIAEIVLGGRGRRYLNISPEYEWQKTARYGLMPTEGEKAPSRMGSTANAPGHGLWEYSENDGTWQDLDNVVPQKLSVVNRRFLGEIDLVRNVWSPIPGGEIELPPVAVSPGSTATPVAVDPGAADWMGDPENWIAEQDAFTEHLRKKERKLREKPFGERLGFFDGQSGSVVSPVAAGPKCPLQAWAEAIEKMPAKEARALIEAEERQFREWMAEKEDGPFDFGVAVVSPVAAGLKCPLQEWAEAIEKMPAKEARALIEAEERQFREWLAEHDKKPADSDPGKKATVATALHLGSGLKRKALQNLGVFQNALPPGKPVQPPGNKKIKLSFGWEGGDGSLDVKPFKLGTSGNSEN